jgi:hypothetical protein
MPDRRRHRGPHPEDAALFGGASLPALRVAAEDLVWLLNRGYAFDASLKLVGDRAQLRARQRAALLRSVCTDASLAARTSSAVEPGRLSGAPLRVDGFNVLTTVEAALGGAVVIRGRDGCYRDLSGVHGSYRRIEETEPAIALVGETLEALGCGHVAWLLDEPVSNSGRLRGVLLATAESRGWPWSVELAFNPDAVLRSPGPCVATADGAILDVAPAWLNLARLVVDGRVPAAWIVAPFA